MEWQSWGCLLQLYVAEMVAKIHEMDPVGGDWYMNGYEMKVWADSNSVVMGESLEVNGNIIKDASWLCPAGDTKHMNLTWLDTVTKSVNMAYQWHMSLLLLITESACVHHWISNFLTNKACVNLKASGEMLVGNTLNRPLYPGATEVVNTTQRRNQACAVSVHYY